ncbi:MAG: cupredoxin family protein [Undibacterium sp.]|nr:cupredoxin family protein [Undibacterium sp.]
MKMTFKPLLAILSLAMSAGASLAAGTHAGGHGHDESAIGQTGVASATTRTVQVDMSDAMRFTPSSVSAKQGETIRFVIRNSGAIKHEFVLGTEKELKEHYEVMKKFPEMEHSDPNMITLAGGETGEIIWQFTKAGKIDFACLQPGHYDAGMKGKVNVAKTRAAAAKHEHTHH